MTKNFTTVDKVNSISEHLKNMGIVHIVTKDTYMNGKTVSVNGKKTINFGLCSYLGLEQDQRLKAAGINAIQRYGTQFSCSKAYMSIRLYDKLEALLEKLFKYPTLVTPSTSLGHLSCIPVLTSNRDLIILDHQVHTSVQNAVNLAKGHGANVEMIRHNDMEALEQKIKRYCDDYDKIWYMADGVYSMYGDVAPLKKLEALLNKYEHFHMYIDDAHGMGWMGENGAGYVLSQMKLHDKMVMATSLNKSFAAGGGALIFPNQKMKDLVNNCGSTMIFSGPLQPSQLGVAIASAKLHLSEEIVTLQNKLKARMKYFKDLAKEFELPVIATHDTPIFFIGMGKPEVGYRLCKGMLDRGFYTSIAVYPSVPYNNTGLRITLTLHQSFENIKEFVMNLAEEMELVLEELNTSKADIYKAFRNKIKSK